MKDESDDRGGVDMVTVVLVVGVVAVVLAPHLLMAAAGGALSATGAWLLKKGFGGK